MTETVPCAFAARLVLVADTVSHVGEAVAEKFPPMLLTTVKKFCCAAPPITELKDRLPGVMVSPAVVPPPTAKVTEIDSGVPMLGVTVTVPE
jgi:hypothetical protein